MNLIDLTDVPKDVLSRKLLAPVVIDWLPERSDRMLLMRGEFGVFSGAVAFAIRADRDEGEALDMVLCDAVTKIGDPATEGWSDKYGGYQYHPAAQVAVDPKDYDDYGVGDDCRLHFTDAGAFDLEEGCAFREVADLAALPYGDRLTLAIALIRRAIEDSSTDNIAVGREGVVSAGAYRIVLPIRYEPPYPWDHRHYRNWSEWSRNAGPAARKNMPLVRALVEAGIEIDVAIVHDGDGNWLSANHVLRLEDGCSGPASFESVYG